MICINGKYRDLTPEENAQFQAKAREAERQYWLNTPYDDAVDAEIRKRYSVSQEFAVLRQADTKPEEYAAYFAYCEECKAYVKAKQQEAQS
jgi:hypothetical protein